MLGTKAGSSLSLLLGPCVGEQLHIACHMPLRDRTVIIRTAVMLGTSPHVHPMLYYTLTTAKGRWSIGGRLPSPAGAG